MLSYPIIDTYSDFFCEAMLVDTGNGYGASCVESPLFGEGIDVQVVYIDNGEYVGLDTNNVLYEGEESVRVSDENELNALLDKIAAL